jgi:UDP-N-acetylmuramoyl-L-alanyl-D-glutamate--2,6-diaminopimelate ligase
MRSPQAAARWLADWVSGRLRTDSRQVRAGDGFIAWPGHAQDARQYVGAALAAGATACLVEAEGAAAFGFDDPRIATFSGLKAATGAIAHEFFGRPGEHLRTVATTGTNGKTSTAWWMAQALGQAAQRCGVVGTLGVGEPPLAGDGDAAGFGSVRPTGLTTPDPVTLHGALREFVDAGFVACALEASSIGLVEHRLAALPIEVALFTNFTPDHLDFHGTMEAYWAAKRQLFDWPGLKAVVLNLDDPRGRELDGDLEGTGLDMWTYAVGQPARLQATGVHYEDGGLAFTLREGTQAVDVRTRLVGEFNVANVLAVAGGLRALGLALERLPALAARFTPVPGRLQRVGPVAHAPADDAALPQAVVDYAHTPDALDKVLAALRPFAAARGGALWCVFGCGGDRDAGKRPVMGRIAAERADRIVITSDNPRSEAPEGIVAQVAAGALALEGAAPRVRTVLERRDAIAQALGEAAPTDVVLIAGKGHEDYQEVRGVKRPFSDAAEASRVLRLRAAAGKAVP